MMEDNLDINDIHSEEEAAAPLSNLESKVKDMDTQMPSFLDIDYTPYLRSDEKTILEQYLQNSSSIIQPVDRRLGSSCVQFGHDQQFQLKYSVLDLKTDQLSVEYKGDSTKKTVNYRVCLMGKNGVQEQRFTGDAAQSWSAIFENCDSTDPSYIYVYARVVPTPDPEGECPGIVSVLDNPYFYTDGDFTVKLKDGDLHIPQFALYGISPYLRAFFYEYPKERTISFTDYTIEMFKMVVDFQVTQRPWDHEKVGEEMAWLVRFLGAGRAIAEVDHLLTYWSDPSCFERRIKLGRAAVFDLMATECHTLLRHHTIMKSMRDANIDPSF